MSVISISDGKETYTNIHELGNTKPIGKKDWIVCVGRNLLTEMDDLKVEINRLNQQMKYVEREFITSKIKNTAVQVLLCLAGAEPKMVKHDFEYFADEEEDDRISRCTEEIGVTKSKFKKLANDIIKSRNSETHFDGSDSLKTAVNKALEALNTFPALRKPLKDATFILENFATFVKYFPQY